MEEIEFFENIKKKQKNSVQNKPKPLEVVLHDPSQPANVRSRMFRVSLGHVTTVYITPRATRTLTSGQTLAERHRNCRLKRENEGLDIFSQYTREGCLLECQLRRAVDRCGCYPWDFPVSAEQDFLFCDIFGYMCVEETMKNVSSSQGCDCPMDCESVSYSYSIVSEPFIEEEQCPTKNNNGVSIFKEFYSTPFPRGFIRKARFYMGSMNSSDEDYLCKRLLPFRALVTFRLATDTVTVTTRTRRLSFFDKLSAFGRLSSEILSLHVLILGGILGLFTGMSILSMVEVVYWITRYFVRR